MGLALALCIYGNIPLFQPQLLFFIVFFFVEEPITAITLLTFNLLSVCNFLVWLKDLVLLKPQNSIATYYKKSVWESCDFAARTNASSSAGGLRIRHLWIFPELKLDAPVLQLTMFRESCICWEGWGSVKCTGRHHTGSTPSLCV